MTVPNHFFLLFTSASLEHIVRSRKVVKQKVIISSNTLGHLCVASELR